MIPGVKGVSNFFQKENFGLLLLRFFWGSYLIAYSIHCFMDGSMLKHLGRVVAQLHFPGTEFFWGVVIAFNLIWIGLFIFLGFCFRLATLVLFVMSLVGCWRELSWQVFVSPIAPLVYLMILSLSFSFVGPGKFSIKK